MKTNNILIGLGVAAMVAVCAFFVFQHPGVQLNSQPLPGSTVLPAATEVPGDTAIPVAPRP